jgi:serine/threonine protein kinase
MTPKPYTLESVAEAICHAHGYAFGGGIGQGGFKETFLATTRDNEKIALKVLRVGCSAVRSDREVDAMKRCKHPNIVALLELAEFDIEGTKYCYLIESYMTGGTLDDRLKKSLLARDELLQLGEQLIRAVAHIADLDLVHRDLKPPLSCTRRRKRRQSSETSGLCETSEKNHSRNLISRWVRVHPSSQLPSN